MLNSAGLGGGGLTSPQNAEDYFRMVQAEEAALQQQAISQEAYMQGKNQGQEQGMVAGIERGKQVEKDRRKGVVTNTARDIIEGLSALGQEEQIQQPKAPQNASEQYAQLQGKQV